MEWSARACRGARVAPRMHAGAAVLGQRACFADHAILLGGAAPSAVAAAPVAGERGDLAPHLLDLRRLAWDSPFAEDTAASHEPGRARRWRRCAPPRPRPRATPRGPGRAAGPRARRRGDGRRGPRRGALAAEAAQAAAATRPRRATARPSRPSATASSSTAAGASGPGAPSPSTSSACSTSRAPRSEEREEIEFHERLEHERSRRDASDAREARMVAYVAKIALADWAAEPPSAWMGREHVAPLVPPLTRAGRHARVRVRDDAVAPGGFRRQGRPRDVEYEPKRPGGGGGADSPSRDDASLASTATLDTWDGARPRERFDATVTADHLDGHFSVLYDDGTREARVPRRRLQLKDDGPWHIVHYGPENHYAVEALVPDKFVADEPGIAVSAKFMLQTTGTEYGWDAAKGAVALDAGVDIRHAGCDFTAEGRGRRLSAPAP
ncbi:hypothetical protein JL720_45 [Aureococcus anophagefferens]|nr:hypothetical protein JL720_45 [Aureococcus anophagefferens]